MLFAALIHFPILAICHFVLLPVLVSFVSLVYPYHLLFFLLFLTHPVPVFAVCFLILGGQCCQYFYVDAFNKRNQSTCEMLHGTGVFFLCVCLTNNIFCVATVDIFVRCTDFMHTPMDTAYYCFLSSSVRCSQLKKSRTAENGFAYQVTKFLI